MFRKNKWKYLKRSYRCKETKKDLKLNITFTKKIHFYSVFAAGGSGFKTDKWYGTDRDPNPEGQGFGICKKKM